MTALIVTHNCADALRRTLKALQSSSNHESLEVVVIDNGSVDGSQQLDSEFPSTHFMRLPKHFGFTKAANIGMRTAKGESIFFVRPGYEVLPETIPQLVAGLEDNRDAGAVCPRIDYAYRLPTPASLTDDGKSRELSGRIALQAVDTPTPVEYPAGAPMLVPRAILRGMNYLDEQFAEFWWDAELCWQIRNAGKRILVLPVEPPAILPTAVFPSAAYASDWGVGAGRYIAKHAGFGSGLSFRLSASLHALGKILTFQNAGFHFSLLTGLISGQRIDGTQS
ncbi:MAG TPA: glycosyltransferase [Bryobacteraceae bacterium]|nr:glycosyltransferase [Bryobacteraceae bacterium]